jgi:HSP20 family protein
MRQAVPSRTVPLNGVFLSIQQKGGENMTNIVKRDPFRGLFAMPRWMEDFDDVFPSASGQRGLRVHEDDKNLVVEAVVAGIPAKEVDIEIEDGVLTVKAEKKEEEKGKGEYKTASYRYYYTCALSGGQWDKAEADVKDGIVTVTIPKTEAARPRKISVKAKGK